MVRITNGIDILEVTRGAYNGVYKRNGWSIVEQDGKVLSGDQNDGVEVGSDDKFIGELMEKPVSGWKRDEINRFAAIKGVDISGTKNVEQAKAVIKEYLAAEEKAAEDAEWDEATDEAAADDEAAETEDAEWDEVEEA